MKTLRKLALAIALGASLSQVASSVAAVPHPAQPIEITMLRDKTTIPTTKTWSSTGAVVDAGTWSIVRFQFHTFQSPAVTVIQLDALFTNDDETGTFTVRIEVVNKIADYDPNTDTALSTGEWVIIEATGIYAGLDGRGSLEGIDEPTITTNSLFGEVMFK